jgi:RNA polymerase subunit RPABC4/transcription elongation factor Spt4
MPSAFSLSSLGNTFTYLTAFFGAFLAAMWLGLVFWTYRDIRSRSQDRLVHIFAPLIVLLLNVFGIVVYLILRPPLTLNETYQQTLEEEALLSQIEDRATCPGCGTFTHPEWQVCAICHTRLRKPCTNCGKLMELPWQICPFCSTPAPGVRPESNASEVDSTTG